MLDIASEITHPKKVMVKSDKRKINFPVVYYRISIAAFNEAKAGNDAFNDADDDIDVVNDDAANDDDDRSTPPSCCRLLLV
jgi:hypothetical protein